MSKHNYSQYSKRNNNNSANEVIDHVASYTVNDDAIRSTADVVVDTVDETVETATQPKTVKGTVIDCNKLNVRVEPKTNARIISVINVGSEVEIDKEKSPDGWFHVCTAAGIEGYCMRQYVNASL